MPQPWREDASNQDLSHTRNRIRWQLLPLLRTFNPQIAGRLARSATISADEEAYWQGELQRLLPALLLPGRSTRGGGRCASTHPEEQTVAIEQVRLRELHPAVARRVLRAAARSLGARLSFEHTEQMLALVGSSRGGKFDLGGGITVERSPREIRLTPEFTSPRAQPGAVSSSSRGSWSPEYGVCLRGEPAETPPVTLRAILRTWKAGDRVTLRHSRGPKKVAEVLDRLHVMGTERKNWPVVESEGKIVWMRGVEVDAPGFRFTVWGDCRYVPSHIISDGVCGGFGDVCGFCGVE